MFRRKASKLPEEVIFPKTLNELGYFVNDQDQIRQIKNPEQKYSFKSNASARVNEMYREAMNCRSTAPFGAQLTCGSMCSRHGQRTSHWTRIWCSQTSYRR